MDHLRGAVGLPEVEAGKTKLTHNFKVIIVSFLREAITWLGGDCLVVKNAPHNDTPSACILTIAQLNIVKHFKAIPLWCEVQTLQVELIIIDNHIKFSGGSQRGVQRFQLATWLVGSVSKEAPD